MKKSLPTLIASSLLTLSTALAQINVQVPVSYGSNQDQIANVGINVTGDSSIRVSVIQIANKYLWVLLVIAIMIVLIVTGFRLMSGKNEKTGQALMSALIAVLIAIFSYTIIRLLINLF